MTGYSKVYEMTNGWRLYFLIGGIVFIGAVGGVAKEILSGNTPESDIGKYIVYFMMTAFFLFGSYLLALSYFKKGLMIEESRLTVYGVFRNKVFERDDILSYSAYNMGGLNNVELHLPAQKDKIKKNKVTLLFKIDQQFKDWFDGIPHKQFGEK
ncbi:MAG: hypothetical protein ABNH16_09290 [Thalassolituus sp.]